MRRQYRYYAILDDNHTLDDPLVVVREWDVDEYGDGLEEKFSTALKWVPSDRLYRISSGRDDKEAVLIDEEAARRFELHQAERVRRANQ